ncbi:hypothetical protein SpAB1_17600 [Streptococcus pyogenes]|nr:hypothetical protein SpAB1_17600 [Streptococcus pyogenes]
MFCLIDGEEGEPQEDDGPDLQAATTENADGCLSKKDAEGKAIRA